MATASVDELSDRAVGILIKHLREPRTELLRELASTIIDLRAHFHLESGQQDWSGRSPGYRAAIAEIYERAQVRGDDLGRLQGAVRYHVGNLLRERAPEDELASIGFMPAGPRARLKTARDALIAMKETAAPRQDVPRLAAYAQALIEYVDDTAIPDLDDESAEASRLALEAVQVRASELLVRLRDAKVGRLRRDGKKRGAS